MNKHSAISLRLFFLGLLGLAMVALPGRGDVVILKDGYTMHGKLSTEKTVIVDKLSGEEFITKKMNGLTMLDDGPRWTLFSAHSQRVGEVSNDNKFADYIQITRPFIRKTQLQIPNFITLDSTTEFTSKWQRMMNYHDRNQIRYRIEQQLDILTPHWARINSYTHAWATFYLTRELGPELVLKLLSTHPDLMDISNKPDVERRAKVVRFLIQANWLNEADQQIDRLLKDMPAEEKKVDELRVAIREARLESSLTELERAKDSGRHGFAQATLKTLPKEKVPAKYAVKVAGYRAEYDAASTRFELAKRLLADLRMLAGNTVPDLVKATEFISEELHLDTTPRLELFLALAEQAETARKANKPPMDTPDKLLAAAVSAWLMGNTATSTDVGVARKRLRAREFALGFLRETSSLKRNDMLTRYQKDTEALPFDEMEMLISLLPPPDADKEIAYEPTMKKTGVIPEISASVSYLLQVPPEYQHGRPYPLLLILPESGETPRAALKKFNDLPARFGVIVAVFDWASGFKNTYNYTDEEHQKATGLLRHLRRTLQVDSDKVFVFGQGEGANFAMDLGASHPDLFAGVVPMTPSPDWQLYRIFDYCKNFQSLPIYMIFGDRAGESIKTIRTMLNEWMPKGYPALAVSYKGRGVEWYGEELPYVFDWMSRKSRATALPELGRVGDEFRTVRTTSNRFYWLSTNEIETAFLYDPQRRARQFNPAKMYARISEGNLITVDVFGLRQVSIWLGKNSIDFAKPVTVSIRNRAQGVWKKEITPKLGVLLEDLYERGDRQRPYYQRIDCTDLHKIVKFAAQ